LKVINKNTMKRSTNYFMILKWYSVINFHFREYEDSVRTCAKGFLKLGLEKYHSVSILGFNSPEWFFSNLGAIYAG
jgi:long-chain-fatty-acid--CoA ligase ACSBG